jgi:hypothetical protein
VLVLLRRLVLLVLLWFLESPPLLGQVHCFQLTVCLVVQQVQP